MTGEHGYCSLYTGTVSTSGTQVVRRTPKYRIVPYQSGIGLAYRLQQRILGFWWTRKDMLTKSGAVHWMEHLVEEPEYYDKNGNRNES